jgi:hypothetical protein
MKIKDLDALKENIRNMFKYKWQNSINKAIYEMIQEDVLKVIDNHNRRETK